MSPFALPVAELRPALTGLGKVLSKQTHLPVLSMTKLERTQDGWITLSATDRDHFVTFRLEQPAAGEPELLLVPYDALLRVTKSCSRDEQILVGRDGSKLVSIRYPIGSQYAEQKVESCPAEEFPEVPQISGNPIPVSESLRDSLQQAFECASTDETRLVLNGAYLDVSEAECHQVIATDGRHLFSSNSFTLPLKKGIILPNHRFLQWKEFNRDGEWQLQIASGLQQNAPERIQINSRKWRFITSAIGGDYPNWRQVVPCSSEMKTRVDIDPGSLNEILAAIVRMPCHDRLNFAIGLEVTGGKVQLLGKSESPEYWTRVDVPTSRITGKAVLIFLNRNFLTKALRFGLARIELIDSTSPLRFSSAGRQMIVMPVRGEAVPPRPTANPSHERDGAVAAASMDSLPDPHPTTNEMSPVMSNNSTSPEQPASPASPNNASRIEESLALIEAMKNAFQDHLATLKDLGTKLRLIQREQRNTEREFQSIRSTLRSLQSVKL